MARRKSLLKLLQDYRAETRQSGNPAHNAGVRDSQVHMLQRTQEWLYDEYDWSFLRVDRYVDLQAGQRYIGPPDDIPLDRIETIDVYWGGDWCDLGYGIRDRDYALHDSDIDARSWPVERWQVYEDEQIELWPIPAQNGARYLNPKATSREGQLRIRGIRRLNPLVDDEDLADLDDRLIVLFAASEYLAANGAADAQAKASAAQKRLRAVRGNMSKTKSFKLFGGGRQEPYQHRPHIPTIHYRDRQK